MSPLSFQLLTVITATICSLDVITASTSISVNVNANALPSSLIPKPQSSPRMSDSTHQTRCMSLTLTKEKQCFLSWARREPTQADLNGDPEVDYEYRAFFIIVNFRSRVLYQGWPGSG
ncbi:hypothetical protein BJ165DRAFT_1403201 [Panaeolus papilionaceus]|nr:hypothetical protein BJ165DRAFT_1403201 [Panaeolus papilionaceus]